MVSGVVTAVDRKFYTGRFPENVLLPGAAPTRLRYWKSARRLFGSSPALLHDMESATYGFRCPFRTAAWVRLGKEKRDAMIRHSRPIMSQMLRDVDPLVVIVAGVAGEALFCDDVGPELQMDAPFSRSVGSSGTYQWRARSGQFGAMRFTLAQMPNLARASSQEQLGRCGEWLTEIVSRVELD
jgi:hypothetical protein